MGKEKFLYVVSTNVNVALVGVAPHGATLRASYTAGENKIALVKYITLSVGRVTAATTASRVRIWIVVTPYAGPAVNFAEARIYTNTVGDSDRVAFPVDFRLMPGEIMSIYTQDASTGGTCDFNGNILIQEV